MCGRAILTTCLAMPLGVVGIGYGDGYPRHIGAGAAVDYLASLGTGADRPTRLGSAFAALHRALSPLRGGTELDGIMTGCRILLYEVNHPGYPNLLVDVSSRIDTVTAAINAHESQLELHNYREAALGMRHYRALSLPAAITAAEGYFEVRPLEVRAPHEQIKIDDFARTMIRLAGYRPDKEIDVAYTVNVWGAFAGGSLQELLGTVSGGGNNRRSRSVSLNPSGSGQVKPAAARRRSYSPTLLRAICTLAAT